MLPADHRLVDPTSFRRATRLGRKAGSRLLTTHLLLDGQDGTAAGPRPAQVGLAVSRAVGTAVRRNLVKRRLRHALRERIDLLPPASVLVVRAHATASSATYPELVAALDRCVRRTLEPARDAQVTP